MDGMYGGQFQLGIGLEDLEIERNAQCMLWRIEFKSIMVSQCNFQYSYKTNETKSSADKPNSELARKNSLSTIKNVIQAGFY